MALGVLSLNTTAIGGLFGTLCLGLLVIEIVPSSASIVAGLLFTLLTGAPLALVLSERVRRALLDTSRLHLYRKDTFVIFAATLMISGWYLHWSS